MPIPQISLSNTGPQISAMVAGFWRLKHWGVNATQLQAYIEQLLEAGVTTMDHAWVYHSEAPFGEVLKQAPHLRERMQIVTKCGIRPVGFGPLGANNTSYYDSSAELIEQSLEASLQDLQTDYVDVLLIHRPDYLMDVHEMAASFSKLKHAGKVRHFGVSNFSTHQYAELHKVWPELVTNQVEFSPYHIAQLESGIFSQCTNMGVKPMLWSCLAGGKIFSPTDAKGERILKAVQKVADELDCPHLDAVVFAWVMALHSRPVPILGTQNITRVKHALSALNLKLNREQWYSIWEAANGAPVP